MGSDDVLSEYRPERIRQRKGLGRERLGLGEHAGPGLFYADEFGWHRSSFRRGDPAKDITHICLSPVGSIEFILLKRTGVLNAPDYPPAPC
jgi:hypothetical protein